MYGKKQTGAVVVTESAAQAALRRGVSTDLLPEEEKVMRMRLGASLPLSARLQQIATATDAEIEIMAYEIEAYLHLKNKAAATARRPAAATSAPATSRTKEKILRALRKKK